MIASQVYRQNTSPLRTPLQQQSNGGQLCQSKGISVVSPTSSSFGWSGPPSFVSSSGPSSPNSSQLDLLLRFNRGNDVELNPSDFSGPDYSGPPSPLDSKYYSNSSL